MTMRDILTVRYDPVWKVSLNDTLLIENLQKGSKNS